MRRDSLPTEAENMAGRVCFDRRGSELSRVALSMGVPLGEFKPETDRLYTVTPL